MIDYYKKSFLHSFGVLVYIAIVAGIMQNGDKIFGEMSSWLGPIAFLLLFTLSALIVGLLILGEPITLYLDGKKKEALSMLGAQLIWLAVFTILVFLVLIII